MKKTLLFVVSALIAGAFTSCSKDDGDGGFSQDTSKKEYTLTGNMNEALLSRMTLGQNDGLYHWESKDSIWVWNADATQHVAAAPTDINGNSATFVFISDFEPKYVTACSPHYYHTDSGNPLVVVPEHSDCVSFENISPIVNYDGLNSIISDTDFYKTSLPYFAQGEITKSSDGRLSFTLQHKMSYIYVKSLPDGYNSVTITTCCSIGYINAITGEVKTDRSMLGTYLKVGEYATGILPGKACWNGIYINGPALKKIQLVGEGGFTVEPNKIYTIDRDKITVSGSGSAGQGPSDGDW